MATEQKLRPQVSDERISAVIYRYTTPHVAPKIDIPLLTQDELLSVLEELRYRRAPRRIKK